MTSKTREQLLAKLESAAVLQEGCTLAPSEVQLLLHRPAANEVASGPLSVELRYMIRRDICDAVSIDAASYEEPWGDEDLIANLRRRNCVGFVAEAGTEIVGQMVYDLHADHLRVLRFAVAPDHRRRGVGRAMMERLIDKLHQQGRRRIDITAPEDSLDSHLFLQAMGFRVLGVSESGDLWFRYTLPVDIESLR